MSRNPDLDAALHELSLYGIRDVVQAHGSRHLELRWQVEGRGERVYRVSCTPSDRRSPANVRADLRRILKEDRVIVDQMKPPAAPAPKLPQRVATIEGNVAALRRELTGDVAALRRENAALLQEIVALKLKLGL